MIELLVVIAVIAILAGLLLPSLARAKSSAQGTYCLNNCRQLAMGWLMYSDDHATFLPYNLAGSAARTNANWAADVLDWETNTDNFDTTPLTQAALGAYVGKAAAVFHCPADTVLSGVQIGAGYSYRVRSYSMNAMVGNAGNITQSGSNLNDPDYVQFFKLTSIPAPAQIFVFLDEHPGSISDGYFFNRDYYTKWYRLPAARHNGGANFSFADGHAESHRWQNPSTLASTVPDAVQFPLQIQPPSQLADFQWILQRMSVEQY